RSTRIVGESTRPVDGDSALILAEEIRDRYPEIVAAPCGEARRVVCVLVQQHTWHVPIGEQQRHWTEEGVRQTLPTRPQWLHLGADRHVEVRLPDEPVQEPLRGL